MLSRKKLVLSLVVLIAAVALVSPSVFSFLVSNYTNANSAPQADPQFAPTPKTEEWTGTEVVSTESSRDALNPSLAVGPDGAVHVAWEDLTIDTDYEYDIYYKKKDSATGLWSATELELVSTESTSRAENPSLAVGLDVAVHVAWQDLTTLSGKGDTDGAFDICYRRKESTGLWLPIELVSTESTSWAENPSLAVGLDGVVHVAWQDVTNIIGDYDAHAGCWDIFYKRKDPVTGLWSPTELVSMLSNENAQRPSLDVGSDGTVYVAWDDYTNLPDDSDGEPDIAFTKKDPVTGLWSPTELVSRQSTWEAEFPSLAVSSDGTVHVAWQDLTNFPDTSGEPDNSPDVAYAKRDAGGWSSTKLLSESPLSAEKPSLAVGEDDSVHVAWQKWGQGGAVWDIAYKMHYQEHDYWTKMEFVSTDSTASAESPSLDIGSNGASYVAWQDLTSGLPGDFDANSTGALDVFYARTEWLPLPGPKDMSDLIDDIWPLHLRDLKDLAKNMSYPPVPGPTRAVYNSLRSYFESKGYTFITMDYNVSVVQGNINGTSFSGTLFSHWSTPASDGRRALLAGALMDDNVDILFGIETNLIPPNLRASGYIIANAMPYTYVELTYWDNLRNQTYTTSVWWYDSQAQTDWYWALYNSWRTFTRGHYSYGFYYRPWWYIWHWLYWKHWNYWAG